MDKVFLQIINMGITSSYVIILVIITRFFLKKAPKVFSYALWPVVLIRLICPFSFESVFSLIAINTQTIPQDIVYSQEPQIHSGITSIDQAVNSSLPAPVVYSSVNPIQAWIALGEETWLLGIAILLIYSIYGTIRFYSKIKFARLVSSNIYETDRIEIPFVFGFIKPRIYLPVNLSENEKIYIIKHEQIHIKRFDYIIKPLAFFVLCIYWFHPLVWIAFFLMGEDMELSCDEEVIKQLGNDIKKDYSASLLSLSTGKHIIAGSPLAFGENNIKARIKNILNYKKLGFWTMVIIVIVVGIICIGLISNPKKHQWAGSEYDQPSFSDINVRIEEEYKKTQEKEYNVISVMENDEDKAIRSERYETSSDFLNSPRGVEFQIAMQEFIKAYFSADEKEMKKYLVNLDDINTYGKNVYNDLKYLILKWDIKDIKSENRIDASYQFLLQGEEVVSYLTLEMKRVDGEWKVLFYALER